MEREHPKSRTNQSDSLYASGMLCKQNDTLENDANYNGKTITRTVQAQEMPSVGIETETYRLQSNSLTLSVSVLER